MGLRCWNSRQRKVGKFGTVKKELVVKNFKISKLTN